MIKPIDTHAKSIQLQFQGISGDLLANVNARISAEKPQDFNQLSVKEKEAFLSTTPLIIQKALQPFGYFNARVTYRILPNQSTLTVYYHIQPGPPVKISQITIKINGAGEKDSHITTYLRTLPLVVGDLFNAKQYEDAKENLLQLISNQGFINARFTKKSVEIHLNSHQATIHWEIDTGERYYFGSFYFHQSPYHADFLKTVLSEYQSQPFSTDKLLTLQTVLEKSPYFDNVAITPEFKQTKNHTIPVQLSVNAPKSKRYLFGIGYGTLTGPRFTTKMESRRINGLAHQFTSSLQLSSVLSSLTAKYSIPGYNPLTDQYTVGANLQAFSPENGKSRSETLSLGYSKIDEPWQSHLTLNYLDDRYTIEKSPEIKSHLLYPSFNLAYLQSNNLLNPTEGLALNGTLQGTKMGFFSQTSFAQAELKGKWLHSLSENSQLLLRGDVGYTIVHDLDKLPLSLRFLTGGVTSVRGYEESSIGPGKYLGVASVEYQHKLKENWSGAIFYDLGSASNHLGDNFKKSQGIGVIYHSFIGPVKVYLAQAMNSTNHPYHIEFSIGPDL